MQELVLGAAAAVWLGILTSVSPCPLATNIAAISYIGRRVDSPRYVFLCGLLYTLGRTLTYLVLAIVLVFGLLAVPQIAAFLQKYMNLVLGPILILVGMFLLEMITFTQSGAGMNDSLRRKIESLGIWGALLLGILFALAFCPTSAALFFGSLVPLSLKVNSNVVLPSAYGIGTALPVIVFAVLLATATQYVAKAYNVLAVVEWWVRMITGWAFVLIGIYFCLKYVFQVI